MSIFSEYEFNSFVQNKILENIPYVKRWGNKLNFRCPICDDSKNTRKKRGWYYVNTNSYYCWNAGCPAFEKGMSGIQFLKYLTGISYSDIKAEYLKSISKNKRQNIVSKPPKQQSRDKILSVKKKFELKDHWVDLDDKILSYIKSRKVLDAPYVPKNWHFYYNKKNRRLVIPWLSNGEINYYQERAIYKDQSPKYLFPKDTKKVVFGLDTVDESFPYMFGLEGAFDSIWVKNGVAIGGVHPTNNQRDILSKYMCEYVHFFDNQHIDKTAYNKIMKLAKDNINAKIFIWPKSFKEKDVNEYIITHKDNPFNDENFLRKNVFHGIKALLQLKMV